MIRLTNILLLCMLAIAVAGLCAGCEPPKPVTPPAPPTDPKLAQALSEISQTLKKLDREPPAAPVINTDGLERAAEKFEKVAAKLESQTTAAAKAQPQQVQSVQKSEPRKYSGWTGCLVHLGPNCLPCVDYKGVRDEHVKRHLADERPWTFGIGENFHFNELYHPTLDEELPKFEFVRNGDVYHTHIGFNGKSDFYKILDLHPNCDWNAKRQAARAAKYSSVERSSVATSGYRSGGSSGGYGGSYANSYGSRARVSGFKADGSLQLEASDDATWGEMKAAAAEEEHNQEWFEYRQNRAVNRQYQAYRQTLPTYGWPVYGSVYNGYGAVGYGAVRYGNGSGVTCVGGYCFPSY